MRCYRGILSTLAQPFCDVHLGSVRPDAVIIIVGWCHVECMDMRCYRGILSTLAQLFCDVPLGSALSQTLLLLLGVGAMWSVWI